MRRMPLVLACVVTQSPLLWAQATSSVAGRVVRAGAGTAIPGVEVVLSPHASRALTDASGEFRFDGVQTGRVVIHVRRLGFVPDSVTVELPLAAPVVIPLRESVQPLDTVSVTGREDVLVRGKLAGFYERKRYGFGTHLEARDLEKMLMRRLSEILIARVPGVRAARRGSATYIATQRLAPHSLVGETNPSAGTGAINSARRPRITTCYPDVYLDGAVVYSSTMEMHAPRADHVLFDINSVEPAHVAAIEFYGGPAQMPAEFNKTGSACGALLIWTK